MNFGRLLHTLRQEEGWSEHTYKDTEGYETLGYGFLIDRRKGVGLPREVGDFWLEHEAKGHWKRLVAAKPWVEDLPEDVQVALGNMCYQLGVVGLLQFRHMFDELQAGDYEEAANEALDSRWAEQTPERANRMADMIRKGVR